MIVDCISDLHGYQPNLEGGNLLIVAGDLTAYDTKDEYHKFNTWLGEQDYESKIVIAGNHDGLIQKDWFAYLKGDSSFYYLQDSVYKFKGLKIWGSPWTPTFGSWYFMKNRGDEIKAIWDLIPDDIDILVTHGPPHGILDRNINGKHCGCEELKGVSLKVAPKLHVFGHIHECGGTIFNTTTTQYINASIMNEKYWPVNKPVRIIL